MALCLVTRVVGVRQHPVADEGFETSPLDLEHADLGEQLTAGIGAGQRHVSNLDATSDKAVRRRRR